MQHLIVLLRFVILLTLALPFLVACETSPSSPAETASPTALSDSVPVISTSAPRLTETDRSSTPSPGAMATRPPTATSRPTPRPTSTPIPTHTPLPGSAGLLQQALLQRSIGQDDEAAATLHMLLETEPGAPETRKARYYLAESFARRQRWASAAEAFQAFVDEPVQDSLTPLALFWLARSYEEVGDWENALATYERYRSFQTVLEPYAAIRQAALYQSQGRHEEAARHYEYGGSHAINPGERAGSLEHALTIYRQLGQNDKALQLYETLLGLAELADYRARLLSEAAGLASDMGQTERAHDWLREIVETAPHTLHAVQAVEMLLDANDPRLPYGTAGTVMYRAGLYQAALPLLTTAITQTQQPDSGVPEEERLELQRLQAMTLRELGFFPEALAGLSAVGSTGTDYDVRRQAQLDWIQTTGQSGDTERAIQGYRDFAGTYPDDPRAPIALDRAAQLLDRLGNHQEAFDLRMELERLYPENETTPGPLYEQAFAAYRSGDYARAQTIWLQLAEGRRGYLSGLGFFWAARSALHRQESDTARSLFRQAYEAAPDTYYGTRAAEELGLVPEPPYMFGSPVPTEDWGDLEQWVAGWSDHPRVDVAQDGIPPGVAGDGFVQRAIALEHVGLYHEARGEWNSARDQWEDDPTALMLLARMAHEYEATYIALKTAEQLAELAPSEAPSAPDALRRMIYPAPYSDLVTRQARGFDIDPRLFYALMRQESLFNPRATSWVGARGLGQVMPSTGEGIAHQLNVSSFHVDDLYRPAVSVRFGAYYIAQQIQLMEGSIQAGLAAYNGGPGNAMSWAGGTHVNDPDLFTEGITFYETRNYVKRVYGFYGAYQSLYAWTP